MEYHEIGEIFEYDGVVLEVVKQDSCNDCFFLGRLECTIEAPMRCGSYTRNDDRPIIYKLVEQCKPKDMEQRTEIKVEGTDKVFATQVTNIQSTRKYTARCSTSCLQRTRRRIQITGQPLPKYLTSWALIMPTGNCVRR